MAADVKLVRQHHQVENPKRPLNIFGVKIWKKWRMFVWNLLFSPSFHVENYVLHWNFWLHKKNLQGRRNEIKTVGARTNSAFKNGKKWIFIVWFFEKCGCTCTHGTHGSYAPGQTYVDTVKNLLKICKNHEGLD